MKIPLKEISKHFYLIGGVVFIVWMLLFDTNNIWQQIKKRSAVTETKEKVDYYKKEIEVLREKSKFISEDEEELERYAREQFYMKKPNEDVFVIVPEEK